MKAWWRRVRPRFFAVMAHSLVRLFAVTYRIRTEGYEQTESLEVGGIFCGWHGRSLVPAMVMRGRGVWVIISHSRDGEMQTGIFQRLGFNVIRGSTGRGGERALIESIKVLRAKGLMALTPDGPRGPSEVVQPGVLMMAKKTGCALFPVGSWANRRWLINSWDRYMVPKPFARCVWLIGEPVFVPSAVSDEEFEALRVELEDRIKVMQARAEAAFA